MALDSGVMSVTVEYAKDLKDSDWFGKQDPYCIIRVGGQAFRTKTAVDGGRNPVWNETFQFNIINENDVEVEVKDKDIGRDDSIGTATLSLAKARQAGSDRLNVPVVSKKSRKQHGFLSISLSWSSNKALKPAAVSAPAWAHHQCSAMTPQQPMPYYAPPAAYMQPAPYPPYYMGGPPAAAPAPPPASYNPAVPYPLAPPPPAYGAAYPQFVAPYPPMAVPPAYR